MVAFFALRYMKEGVSFYSFPLMRYGYLGFCITMHERASIDEDQKTRHDKMYFWF